MTTQKGIKVFGEKDARVVSDWPMPTLRDDYIIVQVKAVALNPTDYKHIDYMPKAGCLVGCDYAGVVHEVGKDVTSLKKGDRIAGVAHGQNHLYLEDGAFAEYITAKAGLHLQLPKNVSFEEASTLGVGVSTCGLGLFKELQLPPPGESRSREKLPILIYGGSTATGSLAIQYAKLANLEVITTCSPRNFDLVRKLGADHVFDYASPTCAADARVMSRNTMAHVFDCISTEDSVRIGSESLSMSGGTIVTLLGGLKSHKENVTVKSVLAYTGIGEEIGWENSPRGRIPAKPEDYEFSKHFWALTEKLLALGRLKPHPISRREGGLDGILDGLNDLREGKISAVKLVYTL